MQSTEDDVILLRMVQRSVHVKRAYVNSAEWEKCKVGVAECAIHLPPLVRSGL